MAEDSAQSSSTLAVSREECHRARDAFYACLDAAAAAAPPGATPPAKDPAVCPEARAEYHQKCLRSWRKYWDDRRAAGRPLTTLQARR